MKKILCSLTLALSILLSCQEKNLVENDDDCNYLPIMSQQDLRIEYGYKSRDVYYTRYENGVLDEDSRYLNKIDYFNEQGYEDSTIIFQKDGTIDWISATIYDEYYQYLGFRSYDNNGTYIEINLLFETFYNEKGLLIRRNEFDESGAIYAYHTYTYNSDDLVFEYEFHLSNSFVRILKYFYNGCSKPSTIEFYDEYDLIGTMKPEYDKFGNPINPHFTSTSGKEEEGIVILYDSNGRQLEWFFEDIIIEKYSYNLDGLLIQEIDFDGENGGAPIADYNYEYKK